jgi:hypothetical protein
VPGRSTAPLSSSTSASRPHRSAAIRRLSSPIAQIFAARRAAARQRHEVRFCTPFRRFLSR